MEKKRIRLDELTGGDRNLRFYFWTLYLFSWPAVSWEEYRGFYVYAITWPLCLLVSVLISGRPSAKLKHVAQAAGLCALQGFVAGMQPQIRS